MMTVNYSNHNGYRVSNFVDKKCFKLRSHAMKSLKALQTRYFISLYRSHCTETLQ